MWALIATLCVITGPGRAECRVEVTRVERDRIACLEMIVPTTELLASEAAAAGMEVLHIAAACERGPMS